MGNTLSQGTMALGIKSELTSGPPFAPTAARNGVSVDPGSGEIVLGSDLGSPIPGMLLDDRQIEMAGNRFLWSEGGNPVFDINPTLGTILLGKRTGVVPREGFEIRNGSDITGYLNNGNIYLFLSAQNNHIGDLSLSGNGSQLQINDNPVQFIMQSFPGTPAPYLFFDISTGNYQIGDINNITNGNKITIDDAASNFSYTAVSARMMHLQFGTMVTQLGDIDAFGSGLTETLDGVTTHDVSNAANTAIYSINGNPGVNGMITGANVATVEGGIITAIV